MTFLSRLLAAGGFGIPVGAAALILKHWLQQQKEYSLPEMEVEIPLLEEKKAALNPLPSLAALGRTFKNRIAQLQSSTVALAGAGGVGGYIAAEKTLEALKEKFLKEQIQEKERHIRNLLLEEQYLAKKGSMSKRAITLGEMTSEFMKFFPAAAPGGFSKGRRFAQALVLTSLLGGLLKGYSAGKKGDINRAIKEKLETELTERLKGKGSESPIILKTKIAPLAGLFPLGEREEALINPRSKRVKDVLSFL